MNKGKNYAECTHGPSIMKKKPPRTANIEEVE